MVRIWRIWFAIWVAWFTIIWARWITPPMSKRALAGPALASIRMETKRAVVRVL